MSQSADHVLDHFELFRGPEYQQMLANKKKMFENPRDPAEVERIREWAKTPEYREKNFAREALTVNPAKACQPLGAVFAAVGFEQTIPFVHGSQGCVAYYRSHFSRHFKEPTSCVSSSMTEDAAVFGGLNNMIDGLANTYAMYKPKMISVSTTCMAEVIGDDLNAFIKTAKEKGSVPQEYDVPFAHTPAFVGSHITGYDNVMKGIVEHFWDGKAGTAPKLERQPNEKINFLGGFDGYTVGNIREIKRIFGLIGVDYTILGDNSDVWDTPTDGEFRMYDGGTTMEEAAAAIHAKATISMQEYCTEKTLPVIANHGHETVAFNHPVGVAATDHFLSEISRITGKAIPAELTAERERLLEVIAAGAAHIRGKKFAIYGDPDLCLGLAAFLIELGAEPTHVLATNGNARWADKVQALFDSSPLGKDCHVYPGRDLWHMRSLLFTEPVDFLIGNTYGKYLERDTGTPLIRIGFPVFDRHHHHRYPVWGYQGAMNVLVWMLDRIFTAVDADPNAAITSAVSSDIKKEGAQSAAFDETLKTSIARSWDGEPKLTRQPNESINFIGGFDGFKIGNLDEMKRIFGLMGVDYTILGDGGAEGEPAYIGCTTSEDIAKALNAKATVSMQAYCTEKTLPVIAAHGQETLAFNSPIGVTATDRFLMELSRITGKEIPEELAKERGRLVDAVADSSAHIHGKKFALYGEPDLLIGLASFLLELGAEPTHVVSPDGNADWAATVEATFKASPFGKECHVYAGKDLEFTRSLLLNDPVDFLIGDSSGKQIAQETGTPLIRIGYPVADMHRDRYPVWGYQGGMNVLIWVLDKIFDMIDANTIVPAKSDYSYDIIR